MKKTWMIHSYQNPPTEVSHAEARKLLDKYGGSYDWVNAGDDRVCHVYLLPVLDTRTHYTGQEELNAFKRAGRKRT